MKTKKKMLLISLAVFLCLTAVLMCGIFWGYLFWEETGGTFSYDNQIKYQFQELNRDISHNHGNKVEARQRFSINGETYVFNAVGDNVYESVVVPDAYYSIQKLDGMTLMLTINEKNSRGFFIKDSFLYYTIREYSAKTNEPKYSFKRVNVLSAESEDITKKEYEAEYFKIEPPIVKISENKKYKKYDFLRVGDYEHKNTVPRPEKTQDNPLLDDLGACWFYYEGTYYLVSGTYFYTHNILCKFDVETQTFTKLARLGNVSKNNYQNSTAGLFLYDGYLYFRHGKEQCRQTKNEDINEYRKRMTYTRVSLTTLKYENVKEKDYMALYNSFS